MRRTKEECLESLRKAKQILGESPSRKQYEELGLTPAHSTIMRKLGGWNKAKEKAGLDKIKRGERNNNKIKPKPDDLDIDDEKWKELTPKQRSYRRYKDRYYKKTKEREQRIRIWFYEYKDDNCCCNECGEEHPLSLDFHHIENQEENISSMVSSGYSIENIKEEMEKCVVLCANCHRKKHFEKPTNIDCKDT